MVRVCVALLVVLAAACSDDDGDTADPAATEPVVDVSVPTGSAVFVIQHSPGAAEDAVAAVELAGVDPADVSAVALDATTQEVTVSGVTEAAADQLEEALDVGGALELRSVLPADRCEGDDEVGEAELLTTLEGDALCVGEVLATGGVFRTGSAVLEDSNGWMVTAELTVDGLDVWNQIASECFDGAPTCPAIAPATNGQLAIVLDGVVITAPQINVPTFEQTIAITGNFSQEEASDLAQVINRGAFPVRIDLIGARWTES